VMEMETEEDILLREAGIKKKGGAAAAKPAGPPEWPDYLRGHNLVFAGDSNDRQFVRLMCQWYNADLKRVLSTDIGENPWNTSVLIFPTPTQSTYCNIKSKNITLINLFHFGLTFEEPWKKRFMQREEELRLPEVPWKRTGYRRRVWATPRQYPEIIWPALIRKISKQAGQAQTRPTILVLQSSLWDAVPLAEMGEVRLPELRRQYYNISWRRRASFLVEASKHSIPALQHLVWRTTPGCPMDNPAVSGVLALQAQDASRAIADARANASRYQGNQLEEAMRWKDVKLLDWATDYNITRKDQCEGAHYPTRGYAALLQGLFNLTKKLR